MNNASFLRKLVFCKKKKKENVISQLRHFLVVHPLLRKIMVNSSWSNVSHGCQVLYALNIIFVCSDRRTDLNNHLLTLFSYVFVSHLLQVGCVLPQMLWLPPNLVPRSSTIIRKEDLVKFDFEHTQCQRGPKYGLFFPCACSYSLL